MHQPLAGRIAREIQQLGIPTSALPALADPSHPLVRAVLDRLRLIAEENASAGDGAGVSPEREEALVQLLASPLGGCSIFAARSLQRQARLAGQPLLPLLAASTDPAARAFAERLATLRPAAPRFLPLLIWRIWETFPPFATRPRRVLAGGLEGERARADIAAFRGLLDAANELMVTCPSATLSDFLTAFATADPPIARPRPNRRPAGVEITTFHLNNPLRNVYHGSMPE